jgi:hypothetical protein
MKSKMMKIWYVLESKTVYFLLLLFLLFTFCQKSKKNEYYDIAQRIVLTDSVSAKFESRLDSIEYLYIDMGNKTLVKQREYSTLRGKYKRQYKDSYFLFSDDKYLYAGDNFFSDDSIFFFPYCSYTLHDTVYYNIDNGRIDGLVCDSGYTIYSNKLDSNRKEYTGIFLTHPATVFEDAHWVFDSNNRIENVCFMGKYNFTRKTNEIITLSDTDRYPKENSVDIFMPPIGKKEYYRYGSSSYSVE